jgi:tetratricopeptide (TPR) repeat protein
MGEAGRQAVGSDAANADVLRDAGSRGAVTSLAGHSSGRAATVLAIALCALGAALAYGNALRNDFALDDAHSIQSNAWVRSIGNVPRYFVDASTFSTLRTNVDYRPLLQATYAVNYALSGYDVRGWRATNLLIHVIVAVTVFFLGRRLFGSRAALAVPGVSPEAGDTAALVAALLFAVHPIGSGCVNYISARSSGLTAALVLPAVVLYLRALAEPPARAARFGALVLLAAGMLTKIEAVSLVPVLFLADLLLDPARQDRPLVRRVFDGSLWRRLWPFVAVAVVFGVLWWSRTGLADSTARAGAGVTPGVYLLTQLRAWWYYVGLLAAPLELVADDPTYPLSRSLLEPPVLLALAGWLLVLTLALVTVRRAPAVTFLLLSFFVWLLPHSSVVPLAEPVNEHRPYLAITGVLLLGCVLVVSAAWRAVRRPRLLVAAGLLVLLVPLTLLTRARNRDWRDAETLWGDTVRKAPGSTRAQMNYGLALMRRGAYPDAEARFREAMRLAPGYALASTNLGIVLAAQGKDDDARRAFDAAVGIAPASDAPYYWRGRFLAQRGDRAAAIADFEQAARFSAAPFREWAALAEMLQDEGRGDEAAAYAARAATIDAASVPRERAEFRATVLGSATRRDAAAAPPGGPPAPDPQAVATMNDGVELMRTGHLADAEARFRRALELAPGYDLAMTNLAIVLAARGQVGDAHAAHDRAVDLAPAGDSPYYWRGRFFTERGDLKRASADFAAAVERAPHALRDLAALAETLVRLGRTQEAGAIAARGEAIDATAFERERVVFAETVRPAR